MSGFLVKVVIEDTHPPVWRRLLLPDQINFSDLLKIIKTAFHLPAPHHHTFSFPRNLITIGANMDPWKGWEENEVLVDQFIETYSFIRCIYEAAEEYRFKLTLESQYPEYQERAAKLIKAKGDTADPARIDQQLQKLKLPRRKSSHPEADHVHNKFASMFLNLLGTDTKDSAPFSFIPPQKEPSLMASMAEEWNEFFDFATGETAGGQSEHFHITQRISEKSSEEMLKKLTRTEADDYCKYLGLEHSVSDSKEVLVQRAAAFLRDNPLYYFWLMEPGAGECLLELFGKTRKANDWTVLKLCSDTIAGAIHLGLAEVQVTHDNQQQTGEILLAKDAADLLKNISKTKLRAEMKRLDKIRETLFPILNFYGTIDFDTLYELYSTYARIGLEKKEFFRVLYWHLRLRDELQTAYTEDQTAYAVLVEADLQTAMKRHFQLGCLLPYKECSREELKLWSKGFCQVYDCWHIYTDLIYHGFHIPLEVCRQHVNDAFQAVRNGADISVLMKLLLQIYKPDSALEYKTLWGFQMNLLNETAIYGLKGYSRQEYQELLGELPESLQMVPENGLTETQIHEDTHLYQMCRNLQKLLFQATYMEYSKGKQLLKKLLSQTGQCNLEMFLYVIEYYTFNGDFSAAYDLLRDAQKKCRTASSCLEEIHQLLDHLSDTDDDFYETDSFFDDPLPPVTTFDDPLLPVTTQGTCRKGPRKIGRNEPCPCGSGKKYKQCCGRNQ